MLISATNRDIRQALVLTTASAAVLATMGLAGCVSYPDCLTGKSEAAALACRAARGDKPAQLELGERLETGVGMAADPARAAQLYRRASSFSSGTKLIFEPGAGGKPGIVLPVRQGIDQLGLPEAKYRLALMYLDGRGVQRDRGHATALLKAAAKAGFQPAATELQSIGEP